MFGSTRRARLSCGLIVFALLLPLSQAWAATTELRVFLDLDNNASTGCTVSTVDGPFAGVEQTLVTTVSTDTAQVLSVTREVCTNPGTNTFGPPIPVDTPTAAPWPIGVGNGSVAGSSAIETYFPLSVAPVGADIHLGVATNVLSGGTGADALITTNGQAGGAPIILVGAVPIATIPTLSQWGLLALCLLLALAAFTMLKRKKGRAVACLAFFSLVALGGVAFAAITLDGQIADWTGISPLANDPAGDAPADADVVALYGVVQNSILYLRMDVNLAFTTPQTINFTSTAPVGATVGGPTYDVTATATSGLPVALTIDPSASAVCSLSGSTVSFLGVGTCVIDGNQPGNASFDPAPQAQQSFAVGMGAQVVTFTSTAPAGATAGGPTYNVTATASPSGLPVTLTIDPSASAVCSIAGSTVSFLGVGTCVVDGDQAGDANYNAAPQAQQSFAVGMGSQTINFTSTAPAAATVAGPTYTVTATATSGLPVTMTIDASASTVCSIAGSTVSFLSVGTCVIDANQPGDANYTAAPQVQQTFAVDKGSQTISFTSTAPASATVGGPTYTVTATATSGLTVALTIDASASAVCSISGSTVSFLSVGTCVIDANQAGDANYNAAPQAQQSFAVGKGAQTITFTSTAPAGAAVGGPTYTVTATASSGLTVALTIDASASAVCSISGSTVSFLSVGTCVIDGNQAGNANFNAAPQAQQPFAVGKGPQTITFTSTAPAGATVGGPTYTVTATASSGLPVTLTIDASASAVCSISGSTVSFLSVGTCVIDGNQAGNANFNAAPQAQQSFAVGKGAQTITFTSTAPAGATVAGPTYTVTATATSGLPVALTIDASASTVCSISGSTVSFLSVGTCVIDGNQAGNVNFNAALQAQQSFAVAKGSQTISFTSAAPPGAAVGGPTYTVTATATSGLPVTLTIDASASTVCSISGSTVSFLSVGTCVIDGNQAGNANYNPAPQAQQSFSVAKGAQTISFTSTAPVGAAVGGPTYTVTATATSGLPVTLTIDASASAVCSISGSTVSFIGAGTCVIDGNQPGNVNYNAAPQAQQSFSVAKGAQTISFTSTAPVGATVGGPTYTVTATATSGLPVTLTIDASASAVCSISGSTVSLIGAGTCVIDGNQPGNVNFNAAPQAQQSFAVAKGSQTISFTSAAPAGATVGGPTYTVTATATSGLPVTLTIDASASAVCSISGSTVSFIGPGTCVIDANQPGNANFNAAPQVQQSFQVNQAPQITSANTTSFTSNLPGTFTVTTTGFPTNASMSITETGSLPSGVTLVNNNNGTATLAGTPAPGTQTGSPYVITITAANGVPPNAVQTFTLNVLNQAPQLATNPVIYTTPGNTQLHVAGATLPGVAAWTDVSSLLTKSGATDNDGPAALTVVPASGATVNGGTFSVNANGSFTYVPPAGFTGTDSFTYQVTDSLTPTTGTVNVTVGQRVWYVRDVIDANNAAGGDGRSTNAFDSIAALNAATTNNGDIIFIFRGNTGTTPLSGNITLLDGQKLWGEGIGLTVAGFGTLVPAGSKPVINNGGGDAVSVPATAGTRQNVEVRGLSLSASGSAVKANATGANNVGITISDDDVTAAGLQGILLQAGSTGTFSATLDNDALAATGNAFDARTSAATTMTINFSNNAVVSSATGVLIDGSGGGTTTITGFANNAVSQNNVGTGIMITSARFDAVPGGAYDQVSGGTTVVGVSGNGVGGSGIVMTGVTGDLAFTDLDIFADGGAGLRVSGTGAVNVGGGTGTRVTVGAGVATFAAIGGPAVDVTNATIDLQLAGLTDTNSATTGVNLDTVFGTFSAPSGSTINNATGTDFNINAGTANVTYAGTISDTTGRLVSVTSSTGGTKSFTGAISDTGSGTGQGIFLNANTGAVISFTARLTLSTGASDAFTATGGGTVTATDTTSTVTTTTGTAVNVQNTTIGAAGLKFGSVNAGTAASGPASGIVLNNTGASGGLTVNGGTIQKTTSYGVSLTTTLSPSFSGVTIKNTGASGVKGTTVTNFSFVNGTVDTTGAGADESSLAFNTQTAGTENNLSGTVTITGNSLLNSVWQGVDILNFNGTIANATISNNTITSPNTVAGSKGSAIRIQPLGSATTVANITTATIANNTISNFPSNGGILVEGGNATAAGPAGTLGTPGTGNVVAITGNIIHGLSTAVPMGTSAIVATVSGKGQANFDITGNGTVASPLTNMLGTAILCGSDGNTTSTFNVANNVIVANNTVASNGIGGGAGAAFGATDTPNMTWTITGNNISATDGNGILAVARGATGSLKVKIQNNTVAAPLSGVREGIRIDAGNAASVNDSVCLNITGNTSAGSGGVQGLGLRKQGTVSTTNAFGVNGMAATATPGVETYVNGLNPAGNGTLLLSATSGFSNCSLP